MTRFRFDKKYSFTRIEIDVLVAILLCSYADWRKLKVNYHSAISPDRQQHFHWMQTRFNHRFSTFRRFFIASLSSDIIVKYPFLMACKNSVQEST